MKDTFAITINAKIEDTAKETLVGLLTEALERVIQNLNISVGTVDMPLPEKEVNTNAGTQQKTKAVNCETVETKSKHSVDDVRTALKKLSDKKGRECAKSILSRFGANKIGELPEDVYDDVLNAIGGELDA